MFKTLSSLSHCKYSPECSYLLRLLQYKCMHAHAHIMVYMLHLEKMKCNKKLIMSPIRLTVKHFYGPK